MNVITTPESRQKCGGKVDKVYAADCPVCIYKLKRRHLMEAFFLIIAILKELHVLNGFK